MRVRGRGRGRVRGRGRGRVLLLVPLLLRDRVEDAHLLGLGRALRAGAEGWG